MTDIDPANLLERCLAGRRTGDWQELIKRHGAEVRRTVRRAAARHGLPLTGPDLDEMVQDLYCRLLAVRRRSFRGRSEYELWRYVMCVAQSLVVDRQRLQGARKRRHSMSPSPADPSRLPSPKLDPEERLLKKERRKVFYRRCFEVVRCGLELRALKMALLEGWSSRDVARELRGGLSADRVDRLVYLLRRHLAREGIRMPRRYCSPAVAPVPEPAC
ncbi:MAG: sigma-70 family RNA polymerase sigma factor [bacterium]|nr:sigma-70 family RNA polymerase sigma factor [bacterium]